ncbi:hypothetical protein D3C80_1118590 [compost metagenome]
MELISKNNNNFYHFWRSRLLSIAPNQPKGDMDKHDTKLCAGVHQVHLLDILFRDGKSSISKGNLDLKSLFSSRYNCNYRNIYRTRQQHNNK